MTPNEWIAWIDFVIDEITWEEEEMPFYEWANNKNESVNETAMQMFLQLPLITSMDKKNRAYADHTDPTIHFEHATGLDIRTLSISKNIATCETASLHFDMPTKKYKWWSGAGMQSNVHDVFTQMRKLYKDLSNTHLKSAEEGLNALIQFSKMYDEKDLTRMGDTYDNWIILQIEKTYTAAPGMSEIFSSLLSKYEGYLDKWKPIVDEYCTLYSSVQKKNIQALELPDAVWKVEP